METPRLMRVFILPLQPEDFANEPRVRGQRDEPELFRDPPRVERQLEQQ